MLKKGTDYLPKTQLCNLMMHDGTLQIKMSTLLHKIEQHFPNYSTFKLKLETAFKMYMSIEEKDY